MKPPPGQEERDPAKVTLAEPDIVPLIDHSEALDGSGEQTENDQTVEVRLSADVLFAVNKADLSPRARSALPNVAARINSSKATVVKIDGYTDDDAINEPLSSAPRAVRPAGADAAGHQAGRHLPGRRARLGRPGAKHSTNSLSPIQDASGKPKPAFYLQVLSTPEVTSSHDVPAPRRFSMGTVFSC
ncbi:OmpA family protein [Actinomadura sp. 3N508]|uniref:OmpA family protein n=1 Tax=Actinomadura sp. 3N508 TaxID=3375153 RepID=UPI003798862B